MFKKKIFIVLIFFLFITNSISSKEKVFIEVYVDQKIITNVDIKKEIDYLKILNPKLSMLENKKIYVLAKRSLINEIIKKKEIEKYLVESDNTSLEENLLKNLYARLDLNKEEFENILLEKNNYTINDIKKKLKNEILWNDLIYFKFNKQVKIDKEKIRIKINNANLKNKKEYLLSEIIFEKKANQNFEDLKKKINSSIIEIGFNNTANIYSISETAKFGGKVGWVDETSLSSLINNKLRDLEKNQYTDVIQIKNNFLILMVNDIRTTKVSIDKDKELKRLIEYETNRQLNQFSKMYLNKAKMNYEINEK
tara:strand:+ start:1133 stop:2062 length:930 start_codon:yes stop_codon:yes gene_type:complete